VHCNKTFAQISHKFEEKAGTVTAELLSGFPSVRQLVGAIHESPAVKCLAWGAGFLSWNKDMWGMPFAKGIPHAPF
jgi:hypothetical protein